MFSAAPRGLGNYFTGSAGDSLNIAVHWLKGLPAQIGQPQRCFPVRQLTTARHAWPFSHCHQTLRLLPGVTCSGVSSPLSVGCYCEATTGSLVARSLKPARTFRPAQYGHPLWAFTRCAMTEQKECRFSQRHQTRRLDFGVTISGLSLPFFFRFHCAASFGYCEARSFSLGITT